jgi:hypothetical protein
MAWSLLDLAGGPFSITLPIAILGIGVVAVNYGVSAWLNHANVVSDSHWHDPPITDSERFWMNSPHAILLSPGGAACDSHC